MKPTPAMFSHLRIRPEPQAPVARVPAVQPELPREARSAEARMGLTRELERHEAGAPAVRKARGPADEMARALGRAALATPAPAMPGRVAVRVMGIDEGDVRVPLGELRVRATAGDKRVEGITDSLGHVQLHLEAEGGVDVEVLSASGEVLAHTMSRMSPEQPVALEMFVQKRPELEGSFASGRQWLEDLRRQAERILSSDAGALERRIAALEATVARLEQALAARARQTRDTDKNKKGTVS